jgi:glycosyltransferase involved in cell wall biosynthesis
MLVGEIYGEVPTGVIRIPEMSHPKKEFDLETNLLVWANRSGLSNTHYSLNIPGWDPSTHSLICEADVINLHWVAECLSASSVAALAALNKAVVWTLHDMRPLTGGCHFPAGCVGFTGDCRTCPQLLDDLGGITSKIKAQMKKSIASADIHFVAPSSWMLENAKKASSLAEKRVSFIPYGVDLGHFTPGDKPQSRKVLGLQSEPFYILLAAHNASESRKGFAEAATILEKLRVESSLSTLISEGMIRILVCGHKNNELNLPGYEIEYAGYLDYGTMPCVYRAADLLLFTSLEDNMPNVIMEAFSCGLPIAAHDLGGVRDLVGDEEQCGILFPVRNVEMAVEGMANIITRKSLIMQMGESARRRMVKVFSLETQASRYSELYRNNQRQLRKKKNNFSDERFNEYQILLNSIFKKRNLRNRWIRKVLKTPVKSAYKIARYLSKKSNLKKDY